jgi:hypothetical protein
VYFETVEVNHLWIGLQVAFSPSPIISVISSKAELGTGSAGPRVSDGLYIGPDAPKGKEKNWISAVAGKAWFPYFRLYSAKKAFLDRTWVLLDIEKAG